MKYESFDQFSLNFSRVRSNLIFVYFRRLLSVCRFAEKSQMFRILDVFLCNYMHFDLHTHTFRIINSLRGPSMRARSNLNISPGEKNKTPRKRHIRKCEYAFERKKKIFTKKNQNENKEKTTEMRSLMQCIRNFLHVVGM